MTRSTDSTPPWIRGSSILSAPADRIAQVVGDFPHYDRIFRLILHHVTVLDSSEGKVRLHVVWDYPFPFRDRDAVYSYSLFREETGWRIRWTNGAQPGDPRTGVRIEGIDGETMITSTGPQSAAVVYSFLGDLGGSFGRKASEKAWREEVLRYFEAIRSELGLPE